MIVVMVVIGALAIGAAATLVVWASRGGAMMVTVGDGSEAVEVRNLNEVIRRLEADETVRNGPTLWSKLARRLTSPQRALLLEQRAVQAALTEQLPLTRILEVKLVGLVGGVLMGVLVYLRNPSIMTAAAAGAFLAAGFMGIDLILDARARKRQRTIENDLPDMLDQMVISVEAGLGLESALTRVAATNDNPLADELTRTLRDMRLGMSRGEALHHLLDRVQVQDFRLFVRALIQADRGGIPVAHVCRTQAEEARMKRRLRAEERAMRMPVKLVFPLVLCILPSLFIVIMGPAVIRLMDGGLL